MKEKPFKIGKTERICLATERTAGVVYQNLMKAIVIVGGIWLLAAGVRQVKSKRR